MDDITNARTFYTYMYSEFEIIASSKIENNCDDYSKLFMPFYAKRVEL